MADLVAFSCCVGGPMAGSRAALVLPHNMDVPGIGAPLAASYELPARQRRDAIHEAAHACVAIAVGAVVLNAEIEPLLAVRRAGAVSPAAAVVIAMAGEAATEWAFESRIARMTTDDVEAYLAAIRSGCGGLCDACRAFRFLTASGVEDDGSIIAAFRTLETIAGSVVRLPMVWPAIVALADELMVHVALIGDRVHEICREHFEPGFIKLEA